MDENELMAEVAKSIKTVLSKRVGVELRVDDWVAVITSLNIVRQVEQAKGNYSRSGHLTAVFDRILEQIKQFAEHDKDMEFG